MKERLRIAIKQKQYKKSSISELTERLKKEYIHDDNTLLMICPMGLGDTYFASGLADKILERKNKSKLIVLCKPFHSFIPTIFSSNYTALEIPEWLDFYILRDGGALPDEIVYAHFQTNESVNLLGYKGVTLLDAYRALFDLPLSTKLKVPAATSKNEKQLALKVLKEAGMDHRKTILLAPEANSVEELGVSFWINLSKEIKSRGWQIMLNSEKYKDDIPHDFGKILLPIEHIISIAEEVAWVISIRSGLCDVLSQSKSKQIVIYPKVQWHGGSMLDSTSIKSMGLSKNTDEIEFDNIENVVKKIFGIINEGKN